MNATNYINSNQSLASYNRGLTKAKDKLSFLSGLLKTSGQIKLFSAIKLSEMVAAGDVTREDVWRIEEKTNFNAFYKAFTLSFSSPAFEKIFSAFGSYSLICLAGSRASKIKEMSEAQLKTLLTSKTVAEFKAAYSTVVAKRVKPAPPVVNKVADVVRPELLDTLGSLEPGQLAEIRQRAEALLKKLDFLALIDGKKGKGKGKGKPAVQ